MLENGFAYIGYSGWTGPAQDVSYAKSHALNIGASNILITNKLLSTQVNYIPLVLPTTSTTTHSGNYSGYSSGNYNGNNYSGTTSGTYYGTSSTHGTNTTYMPVRSDIYETHAYYFVKVDTSRYKFGANFVDVPSNISSQIDINGGAQLIVIKNTPAYHADLISGDVIIEMSGNRIKSALDLQRKIAASNTNETFKVYRNGKFISVKMNFNID